MQDFLAKMGYCFLWIGTIASFSVAVRWLVPAYSQWRDNRAYQTELRAEVVQVQRQIADTRHNIDRLDRSPYYVEQLARENRCVTEDEVLLIFEE